jgi:hypothetical protein
MYISFNRVNEAFGWDISTVKALTVRERRYWLRCARYKSEMNQWLRQQQPNRT